MDFKLSKTRKIINSLAFRIGIIALLGIAIILVLTSFATKKIVSINDFKNQAVQENTQLFFAIADLHEVLGNSQIYAAEIVQNRKTEMVSDFNVQIQYIKDELNYFKNSALLKKNGTEFESICNDYLRAVESLFAEIQNGNRNLAEVYDQFNQSTIKINNYLYGNDENLQKILEQQIDKGNKLVDAAVSLQIKITIIGILLILTLSFFVWRSLFRALEKFKKTTEYLAKGDLSTKAEVKLEDEIGSLGVVYNTAIEQLRVLLNDTASHASKVSFSSNDLFKFIDESSGVLQKMNKLILNLSNGSVEQHDKVNLAVEKMKNIKVQINQDSVSTVLNKVSYEVSREAYRGKVANREMRCELLELEKKTNQIKTNMINLGEDLKEFQELMVDVNDLLEDTKIFSLNLSIERARNKDDNEQLEPVMNGLKELIGTTESTVKRINQTIEKISEKAQLKVATIINDTSEIEQTKDIIINSLDIFKDIELRVEQMIRELENISLIAGNMEENNQTIEAAMEQAAQISESNLTATQKVTTIFEQQYATLEVLTTAARNLKLMSENFNHIARRFML